MIPERCPRHRIEPSRNSCNECADAFEAARDERIARNHAELDARRELHRQGAIATARCDLCDDNARRPDGRLCHHDPDHDERVARGVAACREALLCHA